jgi:hypothetical protein
MVIGIVPGLLLRREKRNGVTGRIVLLYRSDYATGEEGGIDIDRCRSAVNMDLKECHQRTEGNVPDGSCWGDTYCTTNDICVQLMLAIGGNDGFCCR